MLILLVACVGLDFGAPVPSEKQVMMSAPPTAKAATCPCGPNCPCVKQSPQSIAPIAVEVKQKKNKTVVKTRSTSPAFECVNNQRARKGLPPFRWNESLARAAEKCAAFKAAHCLSGHTSNDFGFIDDGAQCVATGADGSKIPANDPNWWTCCMDENYPYAGAGMAVGADGNKYYSLFVSYSPGAGSELAPAVASAPTCADGTCTVQPQPVQFVPQLQTFSFAPQNSCPNGQCGNQGGRRRR